MTPETRMYMCDIVPCPPKPPTLLETLQGFINGIFGTNGLLHLENPTNSILFSIITSTIIVLIFWMLLKRIQKSTLVKKTKISTS